MGERSFLLHVNAGKSWKNQGIWFRKSGGNPASWQKDFGAKELYNTGCGRCVNAQAFSLPLYLVARTNIDHHYQYWPLILCVFCFSKVQARFAFASYLTRVQQRLVAETTSEETEDVETSNEQMVPLPIVSKTGDCDVPPCQQHRFLWIPAPSLGLKVFSATYARETATS